MNREQALAECTVTPYTDRDSCNGHKNYVTWQMWSQVEADIDYWIEDSTVNDDGVISVNSPDIIMYKLQEHYESSIDSLEDDEIITDWRLSLLRNAFEKVDWWGLVCMLVGRVYED